MQTAAHALPYPAVLQTLASPISRTSHTECQNIRFAAADLCRQGRLAEAELLTREALQHHPDSEDVLVIRALISEVRHDWASAAAALERLLQLQGTAAPAESWCHWVRVLRCDGQLDAALATAIKALQHHPAHPLLASELAQLEAMGVVAERRAA